MLLEGLEHGSKDLRGDLLQLVNGDERLRRNSLKVKKRYLEISVEALGGLL